MFKHWRLNFQRKMTSIIYRIQPDVLASDNDDAWTNLGYWQPNYGYVEASSHLATALAESINLNNNDHLLEIGSGYGASLKLWNEKFDVDRMSVLELQERCCQHIQQKQFAFIDEIFHQSLFDGQPLGTSKKFDVILSVDATYHYALNRYLEALEPWLVSKGRIGFHLLLKSDAWQDEAIVEKNIAKKLALAKVNAKQLLKHQELIKTLEKQGYQLTDIRDLTTQVLQGFSDYILNQRSSQWTWQQRWSIGGIKIYSTAKLCRYLAQTQQLRYVQVSAQKLT